MHRSLETLFLETLDADGYHRFVSYKYRNWYLAIRRSGFQKPGRQTKFNQKAVLFLPVEQTWHACLSERARTLENRVDQDGHIEYLAWLWSLGDRACVHSWNKSNTNKDISRGLLFTRSLTSRLKFLEIDNF